MRGYEDVDADLFVGLVTVCGKPSEVAELVDDIHVVVGFGVEGHSNVGRMQELVVLGIVACDVDIVATKAVATLGSKIEGLSVAHHEGVVLALELMLVIDAMQGLWVCPAVVYVLAGVEVDGTVLGFLCHQTLIAQLVDMDVGIGLQASMEEVLEARHAACFRGKPVVLQELLLVDYHAVDEHDALGVGCHPFYPFLVGFLFRCQ